MLKETAYFYIIFFHWELGSNKMLKCAPTTVLPSIGIGTFKIKEENEIKCLLDIALKIGYRHIDTASVYRNEKLIGKHLNHLLNEIGINRGNLFITSKLSPRNQGYETAKTSFLKSLNDLDCSYLDLYLIHWPGKSKLKMDDPNNKEFRKASWKALEELQQEGLVKAIGVSNYTISHLQEMEDYAEVMPAVNQVEFHPHLYQKDLLEYCESKAIQVQAYSSLAMGELINDPLINNIAKKYEKTASQVLLRWGFQHDVGVIPKSTNPEHIIQNFDIFDFTISDEDMSIMDTMNIAKHYCWDPSLVV